MSEDLYSQSATMWLSKEKAMRELFDLKFAFEALAQQCGTPGSYEREMATNASGGFGRRVDYLHDSIARLLKDKP
jgi:hypothetical protein